MNAPLSWFLLANIGFAVLWLFYRLFLHRDTFFNGKRFTLLLGLIFVLTYPLMNVSAWMPTFRPVQSITHDFSVLLPEITVQAAGTKAFSTVELVTYAYLIVSALLLIRVLVQFTELLLLSKRNPSTVLDGQKIICLPSGSAPFSFFGLVFVHPDDHSESDLHEILHHERTHVRQAHTFDVLLAELLCTLFWINPFAWLLKYDLRENLEFLADKDVVHAGFDPKSYQYHLLRLSYQQSPIRMGNNFNVSQLQNRIKMMNKKRTSQAGWGKYLLTLPLFAALLVVSYACKNKTEKDTNAKITVESIPVDSAVSVDTAAVAPPPPPPVKTTIKFAPPKIAKGVKSTVKFTPPVIVKTNATDTIYFNPDQMPEYPGGNEAMAQYIKDNLKYPTSAKEASIEGRVNMEFIVTKTGELKNIKIIRGISPDCNEEAVRVIKTMPTWKPGLYKGKPVDVHFILPITFKLQ